MSGSASAAWAWAWAWACVVLAVACSGACPGGSAGYNKRQSSDVIDAFNSMLEESFVGQLQAVKTVRDHLQDYVEMPQGGAGPLVLHLVGPTGTGKSFLAEMVAKSLFDDCDSRMQDLKGGVDGAIRGLAQLAEGYLSLPAAYSSVVRRAAHSVLRRRCDKDSHKLENWMQACGIVYTIFHDAALDDGDGNGDGHGHGDGDRNSGAATDAAGEAAGDAAGRSGSGSGSSNEARLQTFLDAAARELLSQPQAVLILDDFAHCGRGCVSMLKQLLSMHTVQTSDGRTASAARATIILCSDLTEMGLALDRSESYESALQSVRDIAQDFWGRDSLVLTRSTHVPFAPLSDLEVMRIVDSIIHRTRENVLLRIRHHLAKKSAAADKPYEWDGRFLAEEHTKVEIVDRLHRDIEGLNARAITQVFAERLHFSVKSPTPIERRLTQFKAGEEKYYCNQDIVIRVRNGKSDDLDLELVLI